MQRVESVIKFFVQWFQIPVEDYKIMTEDSVPVFDYFFFLHILFQIIQDILTGSQFYGETRVKFIQKVIIKEGTNWTVCIDGCQN